MASCVRAVTICRVGRRATVSVAGGAAAKMAARQTCPKARGRPRPQKQPLRLTPLHHLDITAPELSLSKKAPDTLDPPCEHCGQDGRAPNLPKGTKAQRVGRARSPLRAGVGYADPASRPESCRPRPYERGYGARPSMPKKKPLTCSTHLAGTAAKMAARRNAITAVMVAAVVRRRIKKGYWIFCGFTLGWQGAG